MGIADWISMSSERLHELPVRDAVQLSTLELWIGALRRIDRFFPDGRSHWHLDYDILVILDACRVDMLKDACRTTDWLPTTDKVTTFRSSGSTSEEWMAGNFTPKYHDEMRDTAYVTANMFANKFAPEQFDTYVPIVGQYEPNIGMHVALPRRLTERAIQLWRERNERGFDRMIVHYMQPHTPFRAHPEWFEDPDLVETNWGKGFFELAAGRLPQAEFLSAYRDNLDWVLDDVKLLAENCEGTIGLSSDHGNGLGEFGVYGHPYGVPVPAVRHVPFVAIEGNDERTLEPKLRNEELFADVTDSMVEEQLEYLGYM